MYNKKIQNDIYKENLKEIYNNKSLYFKGEVNFSIDMFYLAYQNRSDDKIILEELSNTISKIKGVVVNNFSMEKNINSNSRNTFTKKPIF